jgi:DNA polymerase III subunit beta
MKFDIDLKLLKAANVCVSKEESRFYLKGVCVQAIYKQVYIVATDGHRLICFKPEITVERDFSVIIPTQTIADLKLNKNVDIAELSISDDDKQVTLSYCGNSMTFLPIDGAFPDWKRVIPNTISGETAQFNPLYLADFTKVLKALGSRSDIVSVGHNGGSPAFIGLNIDVDYVALVMPMRADVPNQVPSWACYPAPQAVAA